MIDILWRGKYKWIKRVLIVGTLLGVLCIMTVFFINFYVIKSEKGKIIQDSSQVTDKADCILVFGAGLTPEGKPSRVLQARLDRGIELYRAGVSDRLLMSGDHGHEGYDEVMAMKQYAMDAGIPSENIFMDHAGFSTYESVYRARDIFQAEKMVLVTQQYHTYRALYIAEQLGLQVCGVPAETPVYRGSWMLEAREKLARTKEFFNVIFKPEPTYLGDVIPIAGNGDQTNDGKEEFH